MAKHYQHSTGGGGTPPIDPTGGKIDYAAGKLANIVRTERVDVRLGGRGIVNREAEELWQSIRFHSDALSFPNFATFIDDVLCNGQYRTEIGRRRYLGSPLRESCFLPGVDAYELLKTAAETFLLCRCGICPPPAGCPPPSGELELDATGAPVPTTAPASTGSDIFGPGGTPIDPDTLQGTLEDFIGSDRNSYLRLIIRSLAPQGPTDTSPFCTLSVGPGPCLLELIWSYWMEEGMLAQTINTIALRFQNVRVGRGRDPLADLELDPLRPLSGFIWGYLQDEPHRLSVVRRAYEYNHHYGLSLYGRAIPRLRAADPRSKFLEAFHDLLRQTALFYREAADNTVTPDPFPLLVSLKDLHLVLSEGAHNQFRDLPWTARVEMLVQQWMLSRIEMREFLRGRAMVSYPEGWMAAVDSMKRLQGWTDVSVMHFRDLAVYGERLLLSIRHVAWNNIGDPDAASDWALAWRQEVQGYIHAYRMVTGVNLSDEMVDVRRVGDSRYLQPSQHLRERLIEQRRQQGLLR